MKTKTVTITEEPTGWKLQWNKEDFEMIETAAEALKTVQQYAEVLARAGHSSVITINWIMYSRIGRDIVKALQ